MEEVGDFLAGAPFGYANTDSSFHLYWGNHNSVIGNMLPYPFGYFACYSLGAMYASQWFATMRRQIPDLDAAVALLREDVVFRSPVVFSAYHGREALRVILEAVMAVFEDFHYVREIGAVYRSLPAARRALRQPGRPPDGDVPG